MAHRPGALSLVFAVVVVVFAATEAHAVGLPELQVRQGWPGLAARAATPGEIRVAYLGGSITAAEGWRPLTTARLRAMLPHATIVEINAALPGTGSDLGACRLERDVLRHRPNLLLVEFAVNDASTPAEQIERAIEGIVRQTRRAAPSVEIGFVYTVSTPGLADLLDGRLPPAVQAMERVATHYGIPSVNLGVEVARRVAAGALVFKGASVEGERAFSHDGVHPTAAGHRVYFEVLDAALPDLLAAPPRPLSLPEPLHADHWERAGSLLADTARREGEWVTVSPDDPNLRGATKTLLPPTLRAATAGATLEFTFTGTRFGFLGIAAPDSGEFIVTVDGGPPIRDTLFDGYVSPTFCRQRPWFYPATLPPGAHRVRIELSDTEIDKAGIKAKAGRPIDDPAAYAAQRLTLCALLWVNEAP